jgi:hypothetical protein
MLKVSAFGHNGGWPLAGGEYQGKVGLAVIRLERLVVALHEKSAQLLLRLGNRFPVEQNPRLLFPALIILNTDPSVEGAIAAIQMAHGPLADINYLRVRVPSLR